jgi:bifunctional non-homologous end joining protein LigD
VQPSQTGPPEPVPPMLAVDGPLPPDDDAWAFEMKWDGIRAIACAGRGVLRLVSRSGRDITASYPEVAGLAGALGAGRSAMLDGEIVALAEDGWPSFERLQPRMHIGSPAQVRQLMPVIPVTYLAFDLLDLDGQSLLDEPYQRRRALLDGLGLNGTAWQTPPAFTGESGNDVRRVSVQHGLEGIMAKRLDSRYLPGRRSAGWIKIKNIRRQEVVVGGWKPGSGARAGQIGSLLIGYYGDQGLTYAGHTGTGLTQQGLRLLSARLAPLRRDSSPFGSPVPPEHARGVVWVRPELVIEVAFAGWTSAGIMRAASYKGLRDDKNPRQVRRET